jgi:hypothetical protein
MWDDMERPWRYCPNIGVVMADRVAGEGDGKFIFVADASNPRGVSVAPNPNQEATHARCLERVRENIERVCRRVHESTARGVYPTGANDDDEDDDDDDDDDDDVGATKPSIPDSEEEEESRLPFRRKRLGGLVGASSTRRGRHFDPVAAALLEKCTILSRLREVSGRTDLTVTTPDGAVFRSKLGAIRHMESLQKDA